MTNRVYRVVFLIAALLLVMSAALAEAFIPEVHISAESLSDWTGKKDERSAVMTYRDAFAGVEETRSITIRPQGTSSLWYPKKNFTITLDEPITLDPGWGAQREYCLKANYIDPTHTCNVASAKLAGQMNEATGVLTNMPGGGAIDGFPVWVTLNGEDAGLYTLNIPKSAWMFFMDEGNEDHIVMCCEGWGDGSTLQSDCFELDADWSIEVGPKTSKTIVKFDRLTTFIATADDETFVRDFDEYLDLDACLNYYCFICVSAATDNDAKNMLMATWDGQVWAPVLYDLDSLWGIEGSGMYTVSDEEALGLVHSRNRLFQRLWTLYRDQLTERYALLRDGILSVKNIQDTFDALAARIPEEKLEQDRAMWQAEGEHIRTFALMWERVAEYLPLVDEAFGYEGEG